LRIWSISRRASGDGASTFAPQRTKSANYGGQLQQIHSITKLAE